MTNLKSTWTDWATQTLALPTEPMSKELSRAYLTFYMMEVAGHETADLQDQLEDDPLYRMLSNRLQVLGVVDTPVTTIALLMYLSKGSPGNAVIYCNLVAHIRLTKGIPVNITVLTEFFGLGFLSDQSLSKAWDAQKSPSRSHNMLDLVSASTLKV